MQLRLFATIAALVALALLPSAAFGAQKAKIRFGSTSYAAAENAGSATMTVTRSARNGKAKSATNTSASVSFVTANGTALAGTDYTKTSGRLTFPACGSGAKATDPCMLQTIAVPISDDSVIDGNKTVRLSLSSPSRNAVIVNPQKSTLTIADNEGPNQITFDAPDYSVWELGPAAELHAIRSGAGITGAAAVDFSTQDGSAAAPGDYSASTSTLNFAAGEVDKQILVAVTDDSVVEPNETFSVKLANASAGTSVVTPSEQVTVLDDDAVTPAHVALDQASYSVGEGGDVTVTVNRTVSVSSSVSVDYATAAQTALAGVDFATNSDTLSFDPGDTSESFTISSLADSLHEGDENFGLSLSNAVPSSTVVDTPSAGVTITDDDPVPTVSVGQSSNSNGTVTVDVQLSNPSSSPVTVTYVITDGSGQQVATGTVTIPAGQTGTTIQVPVTGSGPYTTTITSPTGATLDNTSSSSTTPPGGSVTPPSVSVTPSQSGGSGNGSGSSTTFDVTLS